MRKEKVAIINSINYCKFPDGINGIEEFIEWLNERYHSFVKVEMYEEEECVAPYFVEGNIKTKTTYWNPASIRFVKEGEITLLRSWEYEKQFDEIVKNKCMKCANYFDGMCKENEKSIREQIDLEGECYSYEKKE